MDAPALFISHGSPMIALDPGDYGPTLRDFARRHPRPEALLVVSAHFLTGEGTAVTSSAHPETIHDFGGFDPALYRMRYPAPGSPALAARVAALVREGGGQVVLDAERGLDHGAWIPLRFLFPDADVPVVQLSLPADAGWEALARRGARLRPLRAEGVWVVGSGGLVHNFRHLAWRDPGAPVAPWASEAEERFLAPIRAHDTAAAARLATEDPGMRLAAPTPEHLAPAFVTLGASADGDRYEDVYTGFRHATLSMRTFAFAAPAA
jgi:4,5-DOPA dioxygenase extradiol